MPKDFRDAVSAAARVKVEKDHRGSMVRLEAAINNADGATCADEANALIDEMLHEIREDGGGSETLHLRITMLAQMLAQMAQSDEQLRKQNDQLNAELEETNRGVVALYGELDEQAAKLRDLNETLEQRVQLRTAEAEARAEQLRALTSELTQAEARERRRLAQTLHDHLQQLLVAAKMRLDVAGSQEASEFAGRLQENVGSLIEEAVDVSRSLAVELSPPVLFQGGLVAALQWLAKHTEEKHALKVEVLCTGDEPELVDDDKQLVFRSVQELVFNVVKHAGTDSAKILVFQSPENHLHVSVVDSGNGFDADAMFDPTNIDGGGFGVLSIRERMHWVGGELLAVSKKGSGTTMTLVMPIRQAIDAGNSPKAAVEVADAKPSFEKIAKSASVERISVLLVDDHALMREGLRGILKSESDIAVIAEAHTGVDAIEMFEIHRPDVVLMDVNMPGIDGIEATRQIKARWPDSVIIGLSMHHDQHVAQAMRDAGAVSYITKVGASDQLCDVIRSAMG